MHYQPCFVQGSLAYGSHFYFEHLIPEDLAGVKVLHGLDKVIEGGAVVLTLKDQDILANGDINEGKTYLISIFCIFWDHCH